MTTITNSLDGLEERAYQVSPDYHGWAQFWTADDEIVWAQHWESFGWVF